MKSSFSIVFYKDFSYFSFLKKKNKSHSLFKNFEYYIIIAN